MLEGLWLHYATLQNSIPSFPWIAPPPSNLSSIQVKEGIIWQHWCKSAPRLELLQVRGRLLLRLEAAYHLVNVGDACRLLHAAERLLVLVVLDVVGLRLGAVAVLGGPAVILRGRGVRVVGRGDGFAACLLKEEKRNL